MILSPSANGARRERGLVRRALGRTFLSHVPGERNRGALSANLLSDPSPAALRALAQRKLRPSLSLAELERAAPSGVSDDAPGAIRPRAAAARAVTPGRRAFADRRPARRTARFS